MSDLTTNESDQLEAEADLSEYERMRQQTLKTVARCDRIEARLDRLESTVGIRSAERPCGSGGRAN